MDDIAQDRETTSPQQVRHEPSWTLEVEDFGPIKRGAVTVSPLTLLVGPNTTGKSYVASLIWGILRIDTPKGILSNAPLPNLDHLQAYVVASDNDRSFSANAKARIDFHDAISKHIRDRTKEVLARIFNCTGIEAKKIEIRTPDDVPSTGRFSFTVDHLADKMGSKLSEICRHFQAFPTEVWAHFERSHGDTRSVIAFEILKHATLGDDALYVPAARTGLVLGYPALVAGLFEHFGMHTDENPQANMPATTIDFLKRFNFSPSNADSRYQHLICLLERDTLNGSIVAKSTRPLDIQFLPTGAQSTIPLHVASSLVTELTPFVMFLKSGLKGVHTLIFEEPEAHLHPAAQRQIARVLVRLVNSGVRVIMTTHSDLLIQQINVLLYLHQHPRREDLQRELGYRDDELLDPAIARGYLFRPGDQGTVVEEMQKGRRGFVEPIMNELIFGMTKEFMRLEATDPYYQDNDVRESKADGA